MWFLGVDQSLTHPGLAILDEAGNLVESGTLSVSSKLRGSARLHAIVSWIDAKVAAIAGDSWVGCIEGPSLNSEHREFDLGEISGAVKQACFARGIDLRVVAPTQLKLFATGSGLHANTEADPRRSKRLVIHAVKTTWGVDFGEDDNAADAYVLARVAYAIEKQTYTRRCQAEVVETLTSPPKKKPRKVRTDLSQNI